MFFRRYRSEILIALATLAIAACWVPIRMRFPFDDTYITFRYSANVAHGFGIVWNPGGVHTEGYTNLLLMLLFVPFSAMGCDLVIVAQAIGVIAVGVSAIALYRMLIAEQEALRLPHATTPQPPPLVRGGGVLVAALFLLDPFTWLNAFSGLETCLFVMWLLLAMWAFHAHKGYMAFAFATLATLTRPEGGLMGFILLAVILLARRRVWKRAPAKLPALRSSLAPFLLAFVLPLALYAIWKLWYFGNLLPNSFYVKVSQAHASGIAGLFPGRGAVRIFYFGVWYLLIFAAVAVWKRWKRSGVVQIATLWCVLLSVFYCFSVLIQNEYERFMYPLEVMLILLTVIGYSAVRLYSPRTGYGKFGSSNVVPSNRMRALVISRIVLITAVITFWSLYFRGGRALGYIERTSEAESSYPHLAEVFRSIPDHEAITLAWGDAGRLPYYSGMRNIDPVGLNTNAIAHARTGAEVVEYVISRKPDLLVVPIVYPRDTPPGWERSHDSARMVHPHGQGLIGSAYPELVQAAMASTYKPLFMNAQPVYDIEFFVDTTSPHYRDIVNTIVPRIGNDSDFEAPAMKMSP